jgi:hypothetical protein
LKPEEEARKKIDVLLEKAGWLVQDHRDLNLGAGVGIAVREFPLKGAGFADYLTLEEACKLLEGGFQYVCDYDKGKIFRKPK